MSGPVTFPDLPPVRYDPGNSLRWALMRWSDVPDQTREGFVYLRRLRVLQTPWFAVYVHWLYLPDGDRDPHDHPWSFWSLVLKGGYLEEFFSWQTGERRWCPDIGPSATKVWRRGSLHRMGVKAAHRIRLLTRTPTVTLIVTGRRRQSWGFWTPDGFVHWRNYDGGRGPDPFAS